MNILALDCGLKTGWATLIDGKRESGVQKLRKRSNESDGMQYLRFNVFLADMNALCLFEVIYYEKPHGLKGNAIESSNGYITRIKEFVVKQNQTRPSDNQIQFVAVSPGTIKKHATGSGRASKKDMIEWFKRAKGRPAIDDNEADALALLEYAEYDIYI